MATRPILFSAPMVRALLDGRKTMTRRILKPQPPQEPGWRIADMDEDQVLWMCRQGTHVQASLRFAPGDLLWVRETWARVGDNDDDIHACPDLRVHAYYRADDVCPEHSRWRPSIFMPRWASRLTLAVTAVKVERLQDISGDDAFAEGVGETDFYDNAECKVSAGAPWAPERLAFADLWNSINGAGAWEANPWVVSLTFTVHRANVDALPGQVAA